MRSVNHQQIAGRINRLKSAIANYSQQAHTLGKSASREAQVALAESKSAIEEIRNLVAGDPVFSKDVPMVDLPSYYSTLLHHAQSSSTIAEEVVEYLGEDEKIFAQDFEDGMSYRRMLKELADRRM